MQKLGKYFGTDGFRGNAQENLTVRLSLSGKTAQEAVKIADQLYMMSPDDWATFDYEKGTSKA